MPRCTIPATATSGWDCRILQQARNLSRFTTARLSEVGVLGFEYGYSLDCPDGLVMWEAQFGDFVNVAQVIIDQFIASAEDKWKRLSGLVLLLPHGIEGQGPEHSSARLERFLTLAAEDNIQVVDSDDSGAVLPHAAAPALRRWKKPLIVMTPKSLLRHKEAVSRRSEFTRSEFQEVIADTTESSKDGVRRILLCSGKIYYELDAMRRNSIAMTSPSFASNSFIRFRGNSWTSILNDYPADVPVFWVQEEPQNSGAWPFLRTRFGEHIGTGRPLLPTVDRNLPARRRDPEPVTKSNNNPC